MLVGRPHEVPGWGAAIKVGQVSGVTVNSVGQPVIFHRGPRVWDARYNIINYLGNWSVEINVVLCTFF